MRELNYLVVTEIGRPSKEIVKGFREVSSASVHEAMGKINVVDPEIKSVTQGMKLVGPAITALCHVGDNLMVHKAMTLTKPGDVLVINAQGFKYAVMWGAQMTISGVARGLAGVVVDGSIRDVAKIREMRFPVFTRAISPGGSSKVGLGSVNIPIQCGGVIVNPGDIMVGDDDGVVVVPKEIAADILIKAKEREAREKKLRRALAEGKLLFDIRGWDKILKEKGVREIRGAP